MSWWTQSADTEPDTKPSSSHRRNGHSTILTELLRTFGFAHFRAHTDILASPFLLLPPELRDHIYRFALLSPNTTLSLLTTSRQLKMEAQPLLYERPIKLSSQAKLFEWIQRSRHTNLRQVKNLSLRLTDIDLSPLLDPDAIFNNPSLSAWTLYSTETNNLDAAFNQLPGLQELTISPPRIIHSQLLRGMYQTLLALIPRHYPNLRLLVIHDDSAIIDAVTALQGLPQVTFREPLQHGRKSYSSDRASSSPESESRRRRGRRRSPKVRCEYEYGDCGAAFLNLEDMRTRLARSYVTP